MAKVTINESRCKGCKLCISVCPKKIIIVQDKLNSKGFHPVGISDMEKCIGCAFCAMMCPDCVIEVEK
ncbi:4Fe-4S dicluster domain-containing protein [Acetivibrio saccincola]|uniref:2-oxoacid:acceptor oxidoreductase n=1 Tax=Acetivibrio saccincola TaxID=1677857 RepID=A0A2S8RC61_9FIRM|nr:4Fe-4S dicluster domain-containing protein [Acetivibrio saccincola]PQQ67386.1 2-oxoacid:acceptor oxidoreductase [Acetivibrio saccincola]HQD29392.1 4Fe-4S dicluster domain-containing protein [Acetivibrio saccincola]